MSEVIKFEWLDFEKFDYWTKFNEVAWIYLITDISNSILYIWQTWNLKERHSNHHRESCFTSNSAKFIYIHRENSENSRFNIETSLIRKYNTTCNRT